MSHPDRYRLDELRTFGIGVATALGLDPARASAFLTSLLWSDAANAPSYGIASLPGWLAAIDGRSIDPSTLGLIRKEHTATAVLDARQGLAPLLLRRAGELAIERAREVGVGLVRVENLGKAGPAGWVASEIAVGPMIGVVQGPVSFALAVPSPGTVAAVFDPGLVDGGGGESPGWAAAIAPGWTSPFAGSGAWLVSAVAVTAFEPLTAFHERVSALLAGSKPVPGEVRPAGWETRRGELLERGLAVSESTRRDLEPWGERLGVRWPGPIGKA